MMMRYHPWLLYSGRLFPPPQVSRRSPIHSPSAASSQSYLTYLADARAVIRTTTAECRGWSRRYDGSEEGREGEVRGAVEVRGGAGRVEVLASDPLECEVLEGPHSMEASSGYLSGSWSEGEVPPEVLHLLLLLLLHLLLHLLHLKIHQLTTPLLLQEVVLSAEEEREFWSAVGYSVEGSPGARGVAAVLARVPTHFPHTLLITEPLNEDALQQFIAQYPKYL